MAVVTCPNCGQENPAAARFCNSCASPLQPEERPIGEERKTVTVVFVDLVDFTARAEQLDPEDVRAVLSPYHAHLRDELERRGGTVEKFIGHAVMAVCGAHVAQRAQTPLVGRERELELLRSLLARVLEEQAQLVTIVGVPGIGKSRLVRELFELLDDEAELTTWRQGRCLPYGESVTFWALGEIVKAETGILESDSPAEAEHKLRDAVTRLVPGASERRWLEAELRALVGVSGSGTWGCSGSAARAASCLRRCRE